MYVNSHTHFMIFGELNIYQFGSDQLLITGLLLTAKNEGLDGGGGGGGGSGIL